MAQQYDLSLWQMDWVWWKALDAKSYDELIDFIKNEMIMQENYPPVVIMALAKEGGQTSREHIEMVLRKYNSSPSKSMLTTVLGVLQDNNVIRRTDDNDYALNLIDDLTLGKKDEITKQCELKIEEFENNSTDEETRYFIALGPWTNWKHTLDNPPFRWGVNPSSASNVGVYNALQENDIVFFYANQVPPTPFSKRGLFGVGRVSRKYDEENEQRL